MTYSSQLRKAMSERGMSQKELAERIGRTTSAVSQYASGRNVPRADTRSRISEALGYPDAWFNADTSPERLNVRVDTAARMLGIGTQCLRVALQNKNVDFGFAVKSGTRWRYHISPNLLRQYVGDETFERFIDEDGKR